MTKTAVIPDQDALKRIGKQVRSRLEADAEIYKVQTDKAEIFAVPNFLSPEECRRFITMIDVVARPSELHETAYIEKFRTSYSGNFNPTDPFVKGISRRIDDLLCMNSNCGESIQGQRYLPGQEFKPHCDYFNRGGQDWEKYCSVAGQRTWTFMVYLNDVEAGGATRFKAIKKNFQPETGKLVCWNNMRPDGSENPNTIHHGMKVRRGVKYVITKWYREKPWGW